MNKLQVQLLLHLFTVWIINCLILLPGWFPVIWLISLPFRSLIEIYMTVPVGAAGVRGLGGRGYLAYTGGVGAVGRGGSNSASYGLKADKQAEEKLYDLLPGMELTPMNPAAMNLKAAAIKPAPQVTQSSQSEDPAKVRADCWWVCLLIQQVLDELCQKNNWGQPVYQLHSAIGPDQRQLFLYKITIPALATQYPNVYNTLIFYELYNIMSCSNTQ